MKKSFITARKLLSLSVLAGLVGVGSGCATANVDITSRNKDNLVRPDFVLVRDLAFSPSEVKTDKGIVTQAINDLRSQPQTDPALAIGESAAKALTDGIVDDLRKAGIPAFDARDGREPTDKTLVISGKFIRIDQGNRGVRVLIGFGFGNGDIKAVVECTQGGRFVAKAIVTTLGSLKPGLAVPVAGAAASGAAAVAVSSSVGGAAAGGSELLLTTVEADAKRAANKIAAKIVQGYINHNWAPPEALNRINGLF